MKWFRVRALLWKYYFISKGRIDRIFDLFYWPLVSLLIWGFTTFYVEEISGNSKIVQIFVGGIVLWTFFQRAQQDITTYVLEDFWSRNLYNLFATPVKNSELVVSLLILGFVRGLVSFVFLILVANILYAFNVFSAGILAVAIYCGGLVIFGWIMGIIIVSFIIRYGMRVQIFAWSVPWLFQPFSAVFYPLSSVPVWLQKVSLMLPSTYYFEGMRIAFDTGKIVWEYVWISSLIMVGLAIVAGVWFHMSMEKARVTGQFAKTE